MAKVVDEALDYSKVVHSYGTYQLSRVVQQTGGQTVTVTLSGGQESVFELPPKVFNLSKSYLSFNLAPPATGTKQAGIPYFNCLNVDGLPFLRQIQLYTRTGMMLCDITDVDRYTNMIFRRENLQTDVLTWDVPLNTADAVLAVAPATGAFEGLYANKTNTIPKRYDGSNLASLLESNYVLIGGAGN